jgi:hypothetical protein
LKAFPLKGRDRSDDNGNATAKATAKEERRAFGRAEAPSAWRFIGRAEALPYPRCNDKSNDETKAKATTKTTARRTAKCRSLHCGGKVRRLRSR